MLRLLAVALTLAAANAECANMCSGHGACGLSDRCTCYASWQGADCSERTCPYGHAWSDVPTGPDAGHNYAECSNRGQCDRKSGECACGEGFTGYGCARHSCPNGCSGHGTCETLRELASDASKAAGGQNYLTYDLWDADKARACKCDPRYSGHDCSVRMCPKGDDPITKAVDHKKIKETTSLQVDEVQNVTVQSVNGVPINGGEVTFTYTDLYNGVWTTRPITLPAAKTYVNNNKIMADNNIATTTADTGSSSPDITMNDDVPLAYANKADYHLCGASVRSDHSGTIADSFVVAFTAHATNPVIKLNPVAAGYTAATTKYEVRGAMEAIGNPWYPLKSSTAQNKVASTTATHQVHLSAIGIIPAAGIYTHTLSATLADAPAGYALRKGDWIYVGTKASATAAQAGCLMQVAEDYQGATVLKTYADDTIGACNTGASASASVVHIQWQLFQVKTGTKVFQGEGAADKHGAWRFNAKTGVIDITQPIKSEVSLSLLPGMWIRLFLKGQPLASYCDMQLNGVDAERVTDVNVIEDKIFVDPDSATSTGSQELCAGFAPTLKVGSIFTETTGVTGTNTATALTSTTGLLGKIAEDSGDLTDYGLYHPTCVTANGGTSPCTGSGLSVKLSVAQTDQKITAVTVVNPGSGYMPGNKFIISGFRYFGTLDTGDVVFVLNGVGSDAADTSTENTAFVTSGGTGFMKNGLAGIAYINNAVGFNTATAFPSVTNTETTDLLPDGAAAPKSTATSVSVVTQTTATGVAHLPYMRAGTVAMLIKDKVDATADNFLCACTIDADGGVGTGSTTLFTCGAPPAKIGGRTPISCVNGLTAASAADYFTAVVGYSVVLFPYNSISYVKGITDEFNAYKFQHLQVGDSVRVSGTIGYQTTSNGFDSSDAATYEIATMDQSATEAKSLFFKTGSRPNGGGMYPMLPVVGTVAFDASRNDRFGPAMHAVAKSWLPATALVQPVVAAKAFAGTTAATTWATTDTSMTNSALDVKRVLEELPNGVVSNVGVAMTANTVGLYAYSVTFSGDGDSGDVHDLVMNSEGCNVDGCQPRYTGVGVQASAMAFDLVVTASSLTVAAWNSKYLTTSHGGHFDASGGETAIIYQGSEGAMNGKSVTTRSAADAATGVVTDGTATAVTKEASQILIIRYKGDTNGVDNTKFFKSVTTEITRGTKEATECSGRGACDGDAGLCECYDGYTGDACEKQTVLM